jgi:hypothetical protein
LTYRLSTSLLQWLIITQSIAENVNTFITHTLFLQLHPTAKNQQNGVVLQGDVPTSISLSSQIVMLRIFERMFVLLLSIYGEEHLRICTMSTSANLLDGWLIPPKQRTSFQSKVCNDAINSCRKDDGAKSMRRIALEEKQRRENKANIAVYVGWRLIEMQEQAERIGEITEDIAPSDPIFERLQLSWAELVENPDFHAQFSREWNMRSWEMRNKQNRMSSSA